MVKTDLFFSNACSERLYSTLAPPGGCSGATAIEVPAHLGEV